MRMRLFFFVSAILLFAACGGGNRPAEKARDTAQLKNARTEKTVSALEKEFLEAGLVDVQTLDSGIKVSLKYSTKDNFTGADLYGDLEKAYLQKEAAGKLVKAEKLLKEKDPSYHLLIYDAARPLSVQKKMWDTMKTSYSVKIKFLADPKQGGIHNYGMAVDIGIVDEKGKELDMGTSFDYFGELASPNCELAMLKQGRLTQQQIDNRKLLRNIMKEAGFSPIDYEWWHFNAGSLQYAKSTYKIIE
jgi:zinc D-Ala-D-Ala dipeptidase